MRKSAAAALGTIGDGRAVEPLIGVLGDADSGVRKSAAAALDKLGWTPGRDKIGFAYLIGKRQFNKCVEIGEPSVEPLIGVLGDADSGVRKSAAEALVLLAWAPGRDEAAAAYWILRGQWDKCVEIGEPAVVPLTRALDDAGPLVRLNAAEALGKIGDSRAVGPLIGALSDNDKDVRKKAARTLVLLYNGRGTDQRTKQSILAVRATITKSHEDRSWVSSTDCTSGHNDTGIGESFPL